MHNYGAVDAHNNYLDFGDLAAFSGHASMTFAFFIELLAACAGSRYIASKYVGANGVELMCTAGEQFRLKTDAGLTAASTTAFTVDATVHSFMTTTEYRHFLDGVADGNGAGVGAYTDTGDSMFIGRGQGAGTGLACKAGHVMAWHSELVVANALAFHAGTNPIPDYANLVMWVRGTAVPDVELQSGTAGTEVGTVTLTADAVDAYFPLSGGGFAFMVMEWLAPVIAVGSFGANLFSENKEELWRYIQQLMGRSFPDMLYEPEAYETFINQISAGRKVWLV